MTIGPISAVGGAGTADPSQMISMEQLYSQMVAGLSAGDVGNIENIAIPGLDGDMAMQTRGESFGNMLGRGLQEVENLDTTAQNKAITAATGDLEDVHDYVIAAVEAQTAVELTTTLRNKALESFQQIMGMQL